MFLLRSKRKGLDLTDWSGPSVCVNRLRQAQRSCRNERVAAVVFLVGLLSGCLDKGLLVRRYHGDTSWVPLRSSGVADGESAILNTPGITVIAFRPPGDSSVNQRSVVWDERYRRGARAPTARSTRWDGV
jgi:hypothetical protein